MVKFVCDGLYNCMLQNLSALSFILAKVNTLHIHKHVFVFWGGGEIIAVLELLVVIVLRVHLSSKKNKKRYTHLQ